MSLTLEEPQVKNIYPRKYATEEELLEAKRESRRRYLQSPAGKAKKREINQRYYQSEKGKAKNKELKKKYKANKVMQKNETDEVE